MENDVLAEVKKALAEFDEAQKALNDIEDSPDLDSRVEEHIRAITRRHDAFMAIDSPADRDDFYWLRALVERVEKAEGEIELANELDETLGLGDPQLPLAEIRSLHSVMEERDTLRIENGILRQKLEKAEEALAFEERGHGIHLDELKFLQSDLAALRLREERMVGLIERIHGWLVQGSLSQHDPLFEEIKAALDGGKTGEVG